MTTTNFTNAPNQHQNPKADFSIFDIHYSARMEQYNAIFYRRIDNLLTIIQLILGSSIAFQLSNNMVTGFLMVAISMFVFTIKPAQVSAKSDIQYHCYLPLITSQLSEEELHTRFLEIQKQDNNVILSLSNIAFIRAGLEKELDVSQEKLSVKEWLLVRFIGETLKMKNNE